MRWVFTNPVRLRPLRLRSVHTAPILPARLPLLHDRARGPPIRSGCHRRVCPGASASVYLFVSVPQGRPGPAALPFALIRDLCVVV